MADNLLNPIVLFFILGVLAGVSRSELKLPEALYETLSIFLLLAIGLKGGLQLAKTPWEQVLGPLGATLLLGLLIPLIAFAVLKGLGRFSRADAAALASHYGSVSAVTFAVATAYLSKMAIAFEEFTTVLMVVLEIPAIAVGVALARFGGEKSSGQKANWSRLAHEVFLGKSIFLLLGGLAVGWIAGPERSEAISPLFKGLFHGALAIFLLEMGIVASRRLGDLRKVGVFLIAFGVGMPIVSALLGSIAGTLTGLSVGGTTILAVLVASASYIAAPAAVRLAIPEANPTYYLTASLGITFPFNLVIGIPLYYRIATYVQEFIKPL